MEAEVAVVTLEVVVVIKWICCLGVLRADVLERNHLYPQIVLHLAMMELVQFRLMVLLTK